ncbi:MAG: phenylacetate--CoA ligase family protein [Limisphaerales bacterium]
MADASHPDRSAITRAQRAQLRVLLRELVPANPFYTRKFSAAGIGRRRLAPAEFSRWCPLTTKAELSGDQATHPPFGTNLTYPLSRYTRCHQTSGSMGDPLHWLDTPEGWGWMLENWKAIYRAAGVASDDCIYYAFSFGPFIGFWLAFEAASQIGCLCLPGGGLSSHARLRGILDHGATVLCCTPTYGLRLGQVAREEKLDLRALRLKTMIVAGEPGGSVPAVRAQLEQLWPGVRVFDHHGMTEVGPVSHECPKRPGILHVLESAYLAEVIDPVTGAAIEPGQTGELVLTTLGRIGSPLLRYRTGDQVKPLPPGKCVCGRYDLALEGGILGRTDDMVVVRGVNIFPSAVDEIIRACGGVAEYRVRVKSRRSLAELSVEIEPAPGSERGEDLVRRLEQTFQAAFALRVPVTALAPDTLPRFEMKAKRWVRE